MVSGGVEEAETMMTAETSERDSGPVAGVHIHTDLRVHLVGDHPHRGEFAHPVGKSPKTITIETKEGEEMYLLSLVNCAHGTDRCYATKSQMRLIPG